MTKYPIETPVEPPIWQGRRGVINTVVVGVLAVVCALGLLFFAQKAIIAPACSVWAGTQGATYTNFHMVGRKNTNNVVCVAARASGKTVDIRLSELVSTPTDLFASFAVSLEFTILLFAILLAILRVWWYRKFGN
jgi:uncharacterized protein (UPF0333 family)